MNYFWQSVDAILEDVPTAKTIVWCYTINQKTFIFQCSKNYGIGNPTLVTKFKVAENMAESNSRMKKNLTP